MFLFSIQWYAPSGLGIFTDECRPLKMHRLPPNSVCRVQVPDPKPPKHLQWGSYWGVGDRNGSWVWAEKQAAEAPTCGAARGGTSSGSKYPRYVAPFDFTCKREIQRWWAHSIESQAQGIFLSKRSCVTAFISCSWSNADQHMFWCYSIHS